EKLDPAELVLYHPSRQGSINFAPYDYKNKTGWSLSWCLVKDKAVYVPSLGVFMNYQPASEDDFFMQATSNGLAGGPTLIDAIVSAAFEVIERDAFIIMWHAKLPCKKINIETHPDKNIIDLYYSYKKRNVELHLFQLPTDVPCVVFMAVGIDKAGNKPAAVIGLGADVNPAYAARQALLEVAQVHPALKQKCRLEETQKRLDELFADPQLVDTLEDHDLLFTHPEMLYAFDFLLQQPEEEIDWMKNYSMTANEKLELLVGHFKQNNTGLLYYNLTAPELEGMHLYTARVIIPGFQPVHFGAKNIRLGGTRLFQLPYKLKLKDRPLTLEDINYIPHPLA
ncbi:MAG: YcaO-like family protein, partial [Ginsengibacter sp.]